MLAFSRDHTRIIKNIACIITALAMYTTKGYIQKIQNLQIQKIQKYRSTLMNMFFMEIKNHP